MGVHGLWDLLSPVGRRVSVETLAGKRLAIDASIWMVQFMKAMRDERGEMVRNAHLIGFFRRICKLLFLRTKPVFVFDGGTPALKRRTVIARRRQRENAQAKIRKTAEKLLLNHVKAMRVKELANNLQDQRDKNNSKGKEILLDESDSLKKHEAASEGHNQETVDEMLAASMVAEESGVLGTASSCAAEIGSSSGNTSASATVFPKEVEDDEDEEMILPITDGNVDPAVLAALPPSMQLDLLVQMRERLMAENRQKYQKVKKAPQNFSELQIEAYLKTVAFRREIDQVQKAAAGKGVGGVQTSRIASESNREFIFSSSFSGDKQTLAGGRAAKISETQQRVEKNGSAFEILNAMASATKANTEAEPTVDEDVETFIDEKGHRRVSRRRAMGIRMTRDLQRNIDLMKELEQERTPVNIEAYDQVNLDNDGQSRKSFEASNELNLDIAQSSMVNSLSESEIHKDAPKSESCIEISFDDDVKQRSLDGDDEFFAHLVTGDRVPVCSGENSTSDCGWEDGLISRESEAVIDGNKLESDSFHAQDENNNDSDVEWEEGTSIISEKLSMQSFDVEGSEDKDIGVEWKEGLNVTDVHEVDLLCTADDQKTVSKGSAEEEAALQEAIRRSLEDLTGETTTYVSGKLKVSDYACNRQLQLKSCSTLPSSHVGSVLDGDKQSQSLINDCGPSTFIDGKDTYGSSSLGMHSTSVTFVAAGTAPHIDIKEDLNEQQLNTSVENAQINKVVECDSNASTDMAACLPGTLPENVCDDVANKKAASTHNSEGFDYSLGQTSSVLEEQTLHSEAKQTVREDDTCPVSVQEQSHDVEFFACKDKENTSEPLGSNFEDELLVLGEEYKNLGEEQRKLERNADSVNAEMFVECQELLQMFGLPYIIAPMEAEAQCAYMELANLVDGVVTDDSDVFLFGAKSVYKNIFDDRKYVETYFMKDIESELGLDREKLIRMALLLGSDYTEGISGIGIVNAIEVVNAFPEEDGFHKFREWIESPDPAIFGKVGGQPGSSSKKKGSKKNGVSNCTKEMEGDSVADSNSLLEDEDDEARNGIQKIKQTFMDKHRNVSKNWHLPASFPSDAVISAYTSPQVDKSNEPLAWGKPDIFSLRRLCWEKFAWASQKADELLLPVLKEYNKHETQLRLEAFYTFNERFAKIRSKRIQKAVKGIVGKQSLDLDVADNLQENSAKREQTEEGASGNLKKKSLPKRKRHVVGDRKNSAKKPKSQLDKRERKELRSTEVESMGLCTEAEKQSLNDAGTSEGRGRRKRKSVGRGRPKENSDSECNVTSISSSDEDEQELLAGNIELPRGVRRSKRARKAASYLEEDEESDGLVFPLNSTDKNFNDDRADEPKSSHYRSVHEPDVTNASEEREFKSHDLPKHGSPGNYLVKGGGFCPEDEDEDEAVKETNCEYLQMGGGFCVEDEGGESNITDAYISINLTETEEAGQTIDPCETVTDLASVSDIVQGLQKGPLSDSRLNLGDKHETTESNLSNVTVTNNNVAQTTVNPFSATPLLKRKRRKT